MNIDDSDEEIIIIKFVWSFCLFCISLVKEKVFVVLLLNKGGRKLIVVNNG